MREITLKMVFIIVWLRFEKSATSGKKSKAILLLFKINTYLCILHFCNMSDKTKLNKLQKMSKKTKGKTVVAIMVVILLAACGNSNHTSSNSDSQDSYQTNDNIENDDSNSGSEYVDNDYNNGDETNSSIEDGTYSATVDYYNPDTGYSNTYTLDVEVEDNLVVQIDFPNDGYLDDTHIEPQELNENGHCSIEDDEGRTFDIQLDL